MRLKIEDLAKIVVVLAAVTAVIYVTVRMALYLFAEYTGIEKFFASLLIVGDTFIILHGIGYAVNVMRIYTRPEKTAESRPWPIYGKEPSVAILVAARHEPRDVLENTFITIRNIDYGNKRIYFLDDSSEEGYQSQAEKLCKAYGFSIFKRAARHGAKAGIINDCLKTLTEEYIAIFDADQNPLPQFLKALIPIMEKDKKLAFIQTPQFYSNIEQSRVARGAAFQQAVFYEYICEGKESGGAMFCCGTNVVLRRKALVEVGGFDESTVTEDFATSIKFHVKGWKSLYYNHVSVFGMAPEGLEGYFKQQFRWASGTISVLKKILWRLLTRPFSLSWIQWWEYLLSGSYYLIGIAFFILMTCPVTYLLFRVPSFFVKPEIYFLAFIPYFVLSISVFYFILERRNYTVKDLFLGQLLASVTFSVYMKGAAAAFFGIKTTFAVTGKTKGNRISYLRLWPQLSIMFMNFIAFVWGMNRFIYERSPAVLINSVWVLYYFAVLCGTFYFNEEKR